MTVPKKHARQPLDKKHALTFLTIISKGLIIIIVYFSTSSAGNPDTDCGKQTRGGCFEAALGNFQWQQHGTPKRPGLRDPSSIKDSEPLPQLCSDLSLYGGLLLVYLAPLTAPVNTPRPNYSTTFSLVLDVLHNPLVITLVVA